MKKKPVVTKVLCQCYRPGPGWSHAGCACFDHTSGLRVNTYGMCRLPNQRIIVGTTWPEYRKLDRAIAVNGGNRRRGVMAWAMQKLAEAKETE